MLENLPAGNYELVGDWKQVRHRDGQLVATDDVYLYRNLDDNSSVLIKSNSGNFTEGLINGIRRYNIASDINSSNLSPSRNFTFNNSNRTITWSKPNSSEDFSFGTRSNLRSILGISDPSVEAHHIITWTVGGQHNVVQTAALDGFHLNMPENGMAVTKFKLETGEGTHANHPAYDDYVEYRLNNYEESENFNLSPPESNQFLQSQLIPELKSYIELAEQSNLSLNEYFKQIVNPNNVPGY